MNQPNDPKEKVVLNWYEDGRVEFLQGPPKVPRRNSQQNVFIFLLKFLILVLVMTYLTGWLVIETLKKLIPL